MKKVASSLIASALLTGVSIFSSQVHALEIELVESNVSVQINKSPDKKYEIVNAADISTPGHTRGYINHDRVVGRLTLPVNARKRSKLRVDWDNKQDVYLNGRNKELVFNYPGQGAMLRFNVFKPVSGKIYLYNQNNQLVKTIPYEVRKENAYRQSVRVSMSERQYQTTSNLIEVDNNDGDISVSYNVQQKREHSSDPYWSFGATLSTDRDDFEDRSINTSFGYTW